MVSTFSRFNEFSLDIETSGLNPIDSRILLTQIGFPNGDNYVIDSSRADLSPLMPFLASKKWNKIIVNGKFDTKFFLKYYNTKTQNIFDPMLSENIIGSLGYSMGLAALAKKYLDRDLDKSTRESFIGMKPMQAFTQEQIGYAAEDVEILFAIKAEQVKKLRELNMEKIAEMEGDLACVVADMELTGVPVDVPKWRNKIINYQEEHEASRLKMHELLFDDVETTEQIGMFVRDSINLNSPKQLKKAFSTIGIDLDSTAEREISLIDHPAAQELLNYRKLQKILSSYGESFLDKVHPFTGRVHPDYQQIGTETGRFSCKEPNVQQIPSEFRECVGSPDHSLVIADFANIELRIIAEASRDKVLLEAFNSGDDPHKATAALMFSVPLDDVSPEQRFFGKTLNFGISYGMGPNKLQDMLNAKLEKPLTFQQTNQILKRYKNTYKMANDWLFNMGNLGFRQGYSSTLMGRKRFFTRPKMGQDYDKVVGSIKRQAANSPIQGTNADITKLAMLTVHDDLRTYGFDASMILQVHDEIVVLARKNQAESVMEVVEQSMIAAAQEVIKTVPVKVDTHISDIWKK